jgi:hypothetical protein
MRVHLRFILITLGVIGLATVLVLELRRRPGFFAKGRSLGGDYRRRTGPCVSMAILRSFLSAATDLPFAEESLQFAGSFLG